MARWRGVVPILALSAGLARGDANADALTLPTAPVRPSLDPVTLSHFLQPHRPHRAASPLAELASSPFGQSAAWLAKALVYGTVCDVVVVRWLLQKLLGHPVFGQGKAAPPPPPTPALQGHGLGAEEHRGHAHPGRGEVAGEGGGGPSQLRAAGLGLCVLVLCAGLARAVSRRRQPPTGAAAAGVVAVRGDRGRACMAALPHGLVQRREGLDAPRRIAKHVTWRSEADWMHEEEVEEVRPQRQSPSNQAAPNTQFFRICSEAPAGVDPEEPARDAAEAEARRQAAEAEAARAGALIAAGGAQLRAVQRRGAAEAAPRGAEGRALPKPAPGDA